MAPIKVGLMGYGFSTKSFHVPFILPNPDLEVYAFLQRAESPKDKSGIEKGKHCTVDHPNAKHYRTADDFFGDKEVDLVIVCTGVDTHTKFAEQAMRSGKHVVVEKPFTITSKEADQLIATQKETGKVLTVFQNRRYDSDFRTLLKVLDSGKLGEVTEFQNHYDVDSPEWVLKWTSPDLEPGEGMLYGLGTHNLDQTLVLYGKPKSVTAFTRALRRESKTDDSFTVVLQYDGKQKNLICTVKTTIVSTLPMEKQLKYLVRGRDGTFIKHGEDPQIDHLFSDLPVTDARFGVEPDSYHGEVYSKQQFDTSQKQAAGVVGASQGGKEMGGLWSGVYPSAKGSYADFYVDVANAILGKAELKVKPEESRMNIRCIELARESAESGKTVEWTD